MWWVRLLCHDSVSVRRKICTFGPAKNMHFWTDEKYVLLGRRKICTSGPTALVRWCVACWYVCTSAERAAKPLNVNRWLSLLQESTVALTICEATRNTSTYSLPLHSSRSRSAVSGSFRSATRTTRVDLKIPPAHPTGSRKPVRLVRLGLLVSWER